MEEPIILILNSLNGVKFSTVNLNSLKSLAFGFVTSLSLFGVLVSGLPLLSAMFRTSPLGPMFPYPGKGINTVWSTGTL